MTNMFVEGINPDLTTLGLTLTLALALTLAPTWSRFVKVAPGMVLDARDDGHASGGTVEVEAAVVRGLFAYPEGGVASLQNSAPLTGVTVSKAIRTAAVSSRPGTAPSAAPSATCTSEAVSSGALTDVSGCVAQVSKCVSTWYASKHVARATRLAPDKIPR